LARYGKTGEKQRSVNEYNFLQNSAASPVDATEHESAEARVSPLPRDSSLEIEVSLVIPIYNAESFIKENVQKAASFLSALKGVNELILVNDSSTDGTGGILREATSKISDIPLTVLHNKTNMGKGYSVRKGMKAATGKYLFFNDADFAYPVEEIKGFHTCLEQGSDVVVGCRVHPESRYELNPGFIRYLYTRHLMSRIFNFMVNISLRTGIRDTQAGIKGFRHSAAKKIFDRQQLNRFSFDLETLFIARKLGLKITERPVFFRYNKEPSTVRFFKDSLRILIDIGIIIFRGMTGKYN